MKWGELHLPYFKRGDDLAHWLSKTGSPLKALEAHARQMDNAAALLRSLAIAVAGHEIEIEADTHMVRVGGHNDIIDALIEAQILDVEPDYAWTDEDDDPWNAIF